MVKRQSSKLYLRVRFPPSSGDYIIQNYTTVLYYKYLLINKPHSVIYSLSKGKRLGSTYDSILLHILTNTFIIMFSNFKLTHVNSRSLIRLSAQKNILKLFFLPTQVNSTAFKAPLFAYNPICNSFFFKLE